MIYPGDMIEVFDVVENDTKPIHESLITLALVISINEDLDYATVLMSGRLKQVCRPRSAWFLEPWLLSSGDRDIDTMRLVTDACDRDIDTMRLEMPASLKASRYHPGPPPTSMTDFVAGNCSCTQARS